MTEGTAQFLRNAVGFLRGANRLRFVPQPGHGDCGLACLAMVLNYHGQKVPISVLRELGTGTPLTRASAIVALAAQFELRGQAVRVLDLEDLAHLPDATILHWNFDHYVVLERVLANGGAFVLDPAEGRRRVSHETMRRCFTGVAIFFDPEVKTIATFHAKKSLVLSHLRRVLPRAVEVVGLSVLVQVSALALPIATAIVVDRVVPFQEVSLLNLLVLGGCVSIGLATIATFLRGRAVLRMATMLETALATDLVEHLLSLPLLFFENRPVGDLMMRANSTRTIRTELTSSVVTGTVDAVVSVTFFIAMFAIDRQMALAVVGLVSVPIAIFFLTRHRTHELATLAVSAEAVSTALLAKAIEGIHSLKSAGQERRFFGQWQRLFINSQNRLFERGLLETSTDTILAAWNQGALLVLIAVGAQRAMSGAITVGEFVAFNSIAMSFLVPAGQLAGTALSLQRLRAVVDRLDDVWHEEPEPHSLQPLRTIQLHGQIRLRKVSFDYAGMAGEGLKAISLTIDPGSFVALVGASGAGKSTLLSLILGLHKPTTGSVLFDERDLLAVDPNSVRRRIGFVPQNPFFFGGLSIRANIGLLDPDVSEDAVTRCSIAAGLHDIVLDRKLGYDTPLGEVGRSFSGGELQRLALARALLPDPPILLLDEPTSAIDARTERAILDSLDALDSTRIMVAHKREAVRRAQRVLVMHEGQVVADGSYDEVLEHSPHFKRLFAV